MKSVASNQYINSYLNQILATIKLRSISKFIHFVSVTPDSLFLEV